MKPAPTLIDQIYRASFLRETVRGWRSNTEMRHALQSARPFVVDEPMSAFMAELANESFLKRHRGPLNLRIADSLRISARLPHDAIWIEYLLRPYQHRSHELRGQRPPIDAELPWKEGWLIQQHPKIETACIMHLFTLADDITVSNDGFRAWTFPFAYAWCCDNSPLPWRTTVTDTWRGERSGLAEALTGIGGYDRDNVACVHSPLIADPDWDRAEAYKNLFIEWTGVIRRVWALLATIDHLPLTIGTVRQSKGFLARGRIRKFLDHHTITLNIPAKRDTRLLARQVIAITHRRRHEVRGHWRDDWRNPPSKRCNPHLWEFIDENNPDLIRCELCHGRQFHIIKHERGDASLGFVTHDYLVKHETEHSQC